MRLQIKRSNLPKGDPGLPGANGRDGSIGPPGLPGSSGKDGIQGENGKPGHDGRDGKDGASGSSGLPGRNGQGFLWKGQWSNQTTYQPYDVVRFSGSSFICLRENTGISPSTLPVQGFAKLNKDVCWDLMAVQGDGGPNGSSDVSTGHGAPGTGVTSLLYIDLDTGDLYTFWNG